MLLQELETHQIELEMQNDELRRTQAALEATRDRFADLYHFAPTGYFTLNPQGLILETNLRGAEQLGTVRGRLQNKPFFLYVAESSRSVFWRGWREWWSEGGGAAVNQLLLKRKDRSTFHARIERQIVEDPVLGSVCRLAVSDISDLWRAEWVLRESEEKYRLLFESNPHPTWLYHPQTLAFLAVNQAAVEHYGYSREEFLRMSLKEIRPKEDIPTLLSEISDLSPGVHQMGIWRHQKKDGTCIEVEIVARTIHLMESPAVLVVATDVTERRRAEEAIRSMNEMLQEKNRQIEEASRARNRFFSYMSHELKTPVNSIVGYAQLLRNGTYGFLAPKQVEAIGRINTNAQDLVHLINNILDLAKLEAGKMTLQVTEVNLIDLAEKVILNFGPQLQEKELLLKKEIEPAFPRFFWTDPLQVRSILTNLLSNAVKFTQRGEIRLRLYCPPEGRGAVLAVSDTGVGIDPAHLERIFDEYEHQNYEPHEGAQVGGLQMIEGTGLGLAIVRRMVHFLQGKIEVSSAPDVGTTFTLFLPEQTPDDPLSGTSPL
ncbi:MAG: PAS domain-containing sensor histidine kinase [Nitrospirae bacterium]|nr:PAS domain-containing sensor histidine kinase [Candidatus Manganitrophaceae bacterium]